MFPSQSNISQFKSAWFKAIFLLSIICTFLFFPLYSHAEGGVNETDENYDRASRAVSGGPSMSKTAWLAYLVTEEGENVSDVVMCCPNGSGSGRQALQTRIGELTPSKRTGSVPWTPQYPFDENGASMCGRVKGWFLEDISGNAKYVVTTLWDESMWDEALENDYKIILEPVEWATVGGSTVCANDYNWGRYLSEKYGANATASSTFSRYTNGVFPGCAKFEKDQVGLVSLAFKSGVGSGNKYTNGQMAERTNALGIMLIELGPDVIHTYWEPHGSPGLEENPEPNKTGKYNMVKVYYTKYMTNGELDHEEQDGSPYVQEQCIPRISVDDEDKEYHLEHWSSNTDFNPGVDFKTVRDMEGPQYGDGAKIVTLKEENGEKTVYVVLVRIKNETEEEDYNYLMTQSMITRCVWFDFPDNDEGMEKLDENDFTWKSDAHKCDGHKCGNGCKDANGNPIMCYCSDPEWLEHKIYFSLWNFDKYEHPTIMATKEEYEGIEIEKDKINAEKRWEPIDNWHYDERQDWEMLTESIYETSEKADWDYICLLMRGADKLTVCEAANDGEWIVEETEANDDLEDCSEEGFAVGNTKSGSRKTDDYYESFDNKFDSDEDGDYETTVRFMTPAKCPMCGWELPPYHDDTREYELQSPLTVHVVVKVEVYSGNPNGGYEDHELDDSDKIVKDSGLPGWRDESCNHHSGRMVNAGNKISFLPYILMKYQTLESGWAGYSDTLNNMYEGWLQAYVLGQYTRSIDPNDYAEIHWDRKSSPNMELLSNQWSTHALATEAWGTNNVLPGGATLGLKIKSESRQVIYATTLQCYTEGYGRDQCEKTGGDPGDVTRGDCEALHEEFVAEVADSIDNTNVQQWQSDNPFAGAAWDDGQKVNRGKSLRERLRLTSGTVSSTEEKYYFGEIISGSNKGDYDVKIEDTVTHTYTFYSDVNGEIHMTIDNTEPGMYDDDGAYSDIANAINERTYVRDKLIAAVEQTVEGDDTIENDKECSDDKALNGEKWYNEEFDGITVIVQETKILSGFIDPAERTEALDPKLTQTQDSKGGEMGMKFNTKDQRQRTYELGQFKTRNYSESYGEGQPEVVATFKGKTVKMHEMDFLYWTRRFWIPNFTVQDLY